VLSLSYADREIIALVTHPKERRQGTGSSVNFKDLRRIFIERVLEKRRPEDSSGTPQTFRVTAENDKPHTKVISRRVR
jgi:hypothetical protein